MRQSIPWPVYGQTESKVTFIFLLQTWSFWANTGGFFSARSGSRYSGWSHIEAFLDILLRRASAETKESSGDVWRVKRRLNKQQILPKLFGPKAKCKIYGGKLFPNSHYTGLTISIASGVVPRVMGSRSFCLALSGDCKCASWLAASTREAGCGIFMPEDWWASGSSKLDLEKDCVHVFRLHNSASGNSWASPPHHFHVYVYIYKYIYTHIVQLKFTLLYLLTLCNIRTMHWR